MNKSDVLFFQLIRDFLTVYLPKQKSASPHTIKSYKNVLNLLIDYTLDSLNCSITEIKFETIIRQHIEAFLEWLETHRNCSVSTRNQRLASLRSFYSYAANRDITLVTYLQELEKIPTKKSEKSQEIKYFSEETLKVILEVPNQQNKREFRNLFFMILLYDTGARNQEILHIRLKDMHTTIASPYVTLSGKGKKTRLVPLMEKTIKHYEKYLYLYHSKSTDDDFLFYILRKGDKRAMSPDNAEKFIKHYGQLAQAVNQDVPDNLHPHMFRHSRAMHLYRNGMPLPLLAEWLGHAQLETTMIYAHADTKMKQDAIEKATSALNPLNTAEVSINWQDDEETIKKLYGLI